MRILDRLLAAGSTWSGPDFAKSYVLLVAESLDHLHLKLDVLEDIVTQNHALTQRLTHLEAQLSKNTDALATLSTQVSALIADESVTGDDIKLLMTQVSDLTAKLATAEAEDDTEAIAAINAQIVAADDRLKAIHASLAPPADTGPAPAPTPAPAPAPEAPTPPASLETVAPPAPPATEPTP